jgi:4-aminobutyrate aminotransferase/(S)-3-amino-2-methylpropionate transaminase
MPVFAMELAAVVVDVDGNSLIDFGSGIAVTTIGNNVRWAVAAVHDQVGCSLIPAYDHPHTRYVAVAEQATELTPR